MANEFKVWINLSNIFYCSPVKKGTRKKIPNSLVLSQCCYCRKVTMLACVNLWLTVKLHSWLHVENVIKVNRGDEISI